MRIHESEIVEDALRNIRPWSKAPRTLFVLLVTQSESLPLQVPLQVEESTTLRVGRTYLSVTCNMGEAQSGHSKHLGFKSPLLEKENSPLVHPIRISVFVSGVNSKVK